MSVFNSYSREQLRLAYSQAWAKHLARSPLSPLEAQIADVIELHPEYQRVVADADTAVGFEQDAAGTTDNPFLHMGLHLAVREQLAIDRPPGIRELHREMQARYSDPHLAEHILMESLGEELWRAQRDGRAPDESRYLALARGRLTPLS
jgi:Domain of unknown function (DUF1841)